MGSLSGGLGSSATARVAGAGDIHTNIQPFGLIQGCSSRRHRSCSDGGDCRFSGPLASCSSGRRYLHARLASGMGSHLAVRGLFATMPGLIWHALHRSQFWVAETILRPHAWRSKACIICHHALGGCCFSVQCSSGRLFRWVGHGHGVAMAGGSGCGWCRLLGVPTYRHTAIWALEGFVPVGCVIVGYCLSRYIVFGCTGSVTAIIPA